MNLVTACLADTDSLPPIAALGYEYIVAANGLFIRAENHVLEACVPVESPFTRDLPGLFPIHPYARLRVLHLPSAWLWAVYQKSIQALPTEAMFQFVHSPISPEALNGWACATPQQHATPHTVSFLDLFEASIDLHSHGDMPAFFSNTDDADEQGLRFYCVIGHLRTNMPKLLCRVGVFGHTWPVSPLTIFDGLGPFTAIHHSSALN